MDNNNTGIKIKFLKESLNLQMSESLVNQQRNRPLRTRSGYSVTVSPGRNLDSGFGFRFPTIWLLEFE